MEKVRQDTADAEYPAQDHRLVMPSMASRILARGRDASWMLLAAGQAILSQRMIRAHLGKRAFAHVLLADELLGGRRDLNPYHEYHE